MQAEEEELPSNSYVNDANQSVSVPLSTTPCAPICQNTGVVVEVRLGEAARGVHVRNSKTQVTPLGRLPWLRA